MNKPKHKFEADDLFAFIGTTDASIHEAVTEVCGHSWQQYSLTGSALVTCGAQDVDIVVLSHRALPPPSAEWEPCSGYLGAEPDEFMEANPYQIYRKGKFNVICVKDPDLYDRWIRATNALVALYEAGAFLDKDQRCALFGALRETSVNKGSFKLVLHVTNPVTGTWFPEGYEAKTIEELARSLPSHIHMYLEPGEPYGVTFSYYKGEYLRVDSFEFLELRQDGLIRRCPEYYGSLYAWYEHTALQDIFPSTTHWDEED